MVEKGAWVRIHRVVLNAEERTAKLPDDTKECDFEMWSKGFLLNDAEIGDKVKIETVIGRINEGILLEVGSNYTHSYGKFVPEIIEIDQILRKEMEEV